MKTLNDVAARLLGMAQNAADRAENFPNPHPTRELERQRVVEFIELAQVINDHIAACPLCKPSQSRSKSLTE